MKKTTKDKEKGEKVEKETDMPMKKKMMKGMPMKGMKSNKKY